MFFDDVRRVSSLSIYLFLSLSLYLNISLSLSLSLYLSIYLPLSLSLSLSLYLFLARRDGLRLGLDDYIDLPMGPPYLKLGCTPPSLKASVCL